MPQTIEGAFAKGAREMIVVLPDSKTVHNGSMYSSSVTTGDFENYIARDVVSYIDAHYRTIASRESRGLVGHSMGGYGATPHRHEARGRVRQPLHHEPVLPVAARSRGGAVAATTRRTRRHWRRSRPQPTRRSCPFGLRAQLASAAAWSPNPKNPPLYLDLPIGDKRAGGAREVGGQRAARVHRSVRAGLRRYRAIAIDVGDQDGLRVDAGKLHDVLDQYGIANTFEIYAGTHTSDVAVRFQEHVMPFFSRTLSFAPAKR